MNTPPKRVLEALKHNDYRLTSNWCKFRGGDFWCYGERKRSIYPFTSTPVMITVSKSSIDWYVETLMQMQELRIPVK